MSALSMEDASAQIGRRVRRIVNFSGVTSLFVSTVIRADAVEEGSTVGVIWDPPERLFRGWKTEFTTALPEVLHRLFDDDGASVLRLQLVADGRPGREVPVEPHDGPNRLGSSVTTAKVRIDPEPQLLVAERLLAVVEHRRPLRCRVSESNTGTVVLSVAERRSLAHWKDCGGVSPSALRRLMPRQTSL
jgi:hypothetical protein